MAAPKGRDGRTLKGAALDAYRNARKRKGGGSRKPARRRPSGPPKKNSGGGGGGGSRAPGIGTIAGAGGSLVLGTGAPTLMDYLARRFGPDWFNTLPARMGVRAFTTMLVGLGMWFGTSTQRGKAAFAAPAIAGGVISTLTPAARYALMKALAKMAGPSGGYVSGSERKQAAMAAAAARRRQPRALPSGGYTAGAGANSGRARYAV